MDPACAAGGDCGVGRQVAHPESDDAGVGRIPRSDDGDSIPRHAGTLKNGNDDEEGPLLGTYLRRGDATKLITQIAYQPEPRW